MVKQKSGEIGQPYIRICRKCGRKAYDEEDLQLFVKRTALKAKYQNLCKICHRDNYKEKLDWVGYKYNISKDEYLEAMASSNVCEICGSTKELCYDHDHNTMKFRGVLCRSCNKAIGALGDTVFGVNRALQFLIKHYDKENK